MTSKTDSVCKMCTHCVQCAHTVHNVYTHYTLCTICTHCVQCVQCAHSGTLGLSPRPSPPGTASSSGSLPSATEGGPRTVQVRLLGPAPPAWTASSSGSLAPLAPYHAPTPAPNFVAGGERSGLRLTVSERFEAYCSHFIPSSSHALLRARATSSPAARTHSSEPEPVPRASPASQSRADRGEAGDTEATEEEDEDEE